MNWSFQEKLSQFRMTETTLKTLQQQLARCEKQLSEKEELLRQALAGDGENVSLPQSVVDGFRELGAFREGEIQRLEGESALFEHEKAELLSEISALKAKANGVEEDAVNK